MKNENGSVWSSLFIGTLLMTMGYFLEGLLAVLGAIIIVTGFVAQLMERYTYRKHMREERGEGNLYPEVSNAANASIR